jgi:hypothetical protein
MTLSRVWEHRITRLSASIREDNKKTLDDLTSEYLKENESRQADIERLILLHVPNLAKAGGIDVLNVVANALEKESIVIHDELKNRYRKEVQNFYGKSNDDTNLLLQYIDAKYEANVLWNGFDIREKADKALKDRELLEWTVASARANTIAAEAARESAEATKAAAIAATHSNELSDASNEVAKRTSWWTEVAAICTALAALGTMVAAGCTAWGIWHPPQSSPAQVFNQSIMHEPAILTGKPEYFSHRIAYPWTTGGHLISHSILMDAGNACCVTCDFDHGALACSMSLKVLGCP